MKEILRLHGASHQRYLFTLYGLFYKKKREVEPEEILHDHLFVTQTSEYHSTNPP